MGFSDIIEDIKKGDYIKLEYIEIGNLLLVDFINRHNIPLPYLFVKEDSAGDLKGMKFYTLYGTIYKKEVYFYVDWIAAGINPNNIKEFKEYIEKTILENI